MLAPVVQSQWHIKVVVLAAVVSLTGVAVVVGVEALRRGRSVLCSFQTILHNFDRIYAPPGRSNQIDARLRDSSQEELLASFKRLKINQAEPPLRPDYGTAGTAVTVRTNHFPMSIPKGPFYEYQVVITPVVKIKHVKRRIFELAEDTNDWKATLAGFVAHDHSAKLVAHKLLPQPLTINVPFYDEDDDPPPEGVQAGKEYSLSIDFVQELETESIQRQAKYL